LSWGSIRRRVEERSMKHHWKLKALLLTACCLSGCSVENPGDGTMPKVDPVKPSGKMKLTSPAFRHNEAMDRKYTKYGQNVRPPLSWTGAPGGVQSFALLCTDPDAIPVAGKEWVHWVLLDLPAGTKELPESPGKLPAGARELRTDFGTEGYGGPRPPAGTGVHHYIFTLYALKTKSLEVSSGATLAEIREAIGKEELDRAALVGTYEKN